MSNQSEILEQWGLTIIPSPTLEKELMVAITCLLNSNIPKLLQILYRLDVPEKKVVEAMNSKNKNEIAVKLARLILTRESVKIK